MSSVIRFESAELVYPNGFHGLKKVSLDIQPGEFVAIIGRSGAGKSTLLRAINRTISITGGKGVVLNHDLRTMPRSELKALRSDIGFIFQQFNLVKNLTAMDNVLHGRLSYVPLWRSLIGLYPEEDRKLAIEALDSVGLDQKHDSRVDELSGGQQQRVAIARAIVQNPKLILADEPMASLDPKLSETVLQLLQKFNGERKMTVLVNMHVLDHARRFATRIIGMRQGSVVFDGPVAALDAKALEEVYEGAVVNSARRNLGFIVFVLLCAAFAVCARAVEFDLGRLLDGRQFMIDFVTGMWPPNAAIFPRVWDATLQTIQLAFVATILAAIFSLPFGFLGASNVMKSPTQKAIASGVRFLLNANRAVDAIIVATFFVSAVGLGPFAGTLALAIHSVGMLGKMFFESVEGVDKGPIEALEAAGASRLQVLRWAIWPQALPYFLSHTLFRFELNIRGAVVLGIVGAGGIGFILTEYQRLFLYQNVAVVLLTIVALVMSIDAISGWTRRKLL